jgi:hypothetical protein
VIAGGTAQPRIDDTRKHFAGSFIDDAIIAVPVRRKIHGLTRHTWHGFPGFMTNPVVEPHAIEACMLRLVAERGPEKSICPSDVARALAGPASEQWGPLMQPVRHVAVRLAEAGRLVILRKGKLVDPHDFKGVYRLSQPRSD